MINVNLAVQTEATCTPSCGSNGQCVDGQCVCDNGWTGAGCATNLCTFTGNHYTLFPLFSFIYYYHVQILPLKPSSLLDRPSDTPSGATWLPLPLDGLHPILMTPGGMLLLL